MFKFIFIILSGLYSVQSYAKAKKNIHVYSWPVPNFIEKAPSLELALDPVFGRLVCPVLSRFNPRSKSFDPLILSQVKEIKNDLPNSVSYKWELQLRKGLFWWDKTPLQALDLGLFLEEHLVSIVDRAGGGLWSVPKFKIKVLSQLVLELEWSEKPIFGPYILNHIPLWRKQKLSHEDLAYECVGLYKPSFHKKNVILKPNGGYQYGYPSISFLDKKPIGSHINKPYKTFDFQMPDTLSIDSSKRLALSNVPCKNLVPLPFVSTIIWNTKSPFFKHKKIRSLFDSLIPRNHILYSGAGGWGEFFSSFAINPSKDIKRHDDKSISLESFKKILTPFSYEWENVHNFLIHSKDKNRVSLSIASLDSDDLPSKILEDIFESYGIQTKTHTLSHFKTWQGFDALVASLWLMSPDMNFFPYFHSKSKMQIAPLTSNNHDTSLDADFFEYAIKLTHGFYDEDQLNKLSKKWFDSIYVSPILRHSACLKYDGPEEKTKIFKTQDPDWFRWVISK